MASLESPVAATRRAAIDHDGGSNAGPLPLDSLYEVLLHLPAKELCRLRVICRAWRSLLSSSGFAAAHAARHSEMLFLATSTEGDSIVNVLDLSGRTLKRVRLTEGEMVVRMASDFVCIKTIERGSFRLLNPATGSEYHLPTKLAEVHLARGVKLCDYGEPVYLFGKVANTPGVYKVLRMFPYRHGRGRNDMFEVCTVSRRSPVQWRGKKRPTEDFLWNEWTRVIIGGVVYFLTVDAYVAFLSRQATEKNWIVSFNLEAEEWGTGIKGPSSLVDDERLNGYHGSMSRQLTLANLDNFLVIVHGPTPYMDLWFLMDSEKNIWMKNYSVQVERYEHISPVHPLVMLGDGKIVVRCKDLLQILDSRTNTFSNLMNLSHFSGISMYTGNLLSLDVEN